MASPSAKALAEFVVKYKDQVKVVTAVDWTKLMTEVLVDKSVFGMAASGSATPRKPFKVPAPGNTDQQMRARNKMIAMRLRIQEGMDLPFDHCMTHETRDRVLVFLVLGDKPITLEDDPNLFPSDTLITQMRVLLG
jgi:hypothetical protein